MSDFEFFFSYYGLVLGLSVAVIVGGLARALNARRDLAIGVLTPLLALFILLDITSFWLFAWDGRDRLVVGWSTLFSGLITAGTYYLASSMLFPHADSGWDSLDQHYWSKKRWVVGGILAANAMIAITAFAARPPELDDWLTYVWQIAYFGPLIALLLSRRRGLDIGLLVWLIAYYLATATGAVPESNWGQATIL
jgi:hypothetical protein